MMVIKCNNYLERIYSWCGQEHKALLWALCCILKINSQYLFMMLVDVLIQQNTKDRD